MSKPDAKVLINEYMVACYGTTEYPEDMSGILLTVKGDAEETISYEYRCREAAQENAAETSAVIPAIKTKVSLTAEKQDGMTGYIREGYAFSPMFTLGFTKEISEKEVARTWLNLERAD